MSDLVRISQLSALSSVDLASNYFVVLDENDTTQSAEGSTKKVAGSTISDAIWALSSLYITASDSSTTTTVNVNSANWQNTFTNFSTQSANNISVRTTVNSNSANWQNTFTNFSTQSANNISVRTTVNSNSANWQSVYSTVNANSATTWVGGGAILNPGVTYIQTNGNDTTAQLGNPAKPYLTVAAALSAVSAASQTRPTLVLGRGTFVGDALLTSSALSIFMTGAGLGATTVNATWNGEDGVIGAAGDPPGSGGDGESFMGCPLLSSDKSLTLNIAITGGNGNTGGENTGSGSGGTGGNGGSIAGVTLRGVSGSLSMIPGPLGTGGNGEEGSGGDGLDGTVGQSSLQFCYLTTAGVDFIGASFSIINNAAVIEV